MAQERLKQPSSSLLRVMKQFSILFHKLFRALKDAKRSFHQCYFVIASCVMTWGSKYLPNLSHRFFPRKDNRSGSNAVMLPDEKEANVAARYGELTESIKQSAALFFDEMFAPLLTTEWGKRASLGALILFLVLLVVSFINTVVAWDKDFFITRAHVTTMSHPEDEVTEAIAQIPNEHLFGNAEISDQGYVPITSLQLHLVGVVSSAEVNQSHVIISEAGSPGKVYAVGDSLPSGIRVYAINDDGVILDNGGHLEKLPLARPRLNFQGMPKTLWDQG